MLFNFNLGKLKFPKMNLSKLSSVKLRPPAPRIGSNTINNIVKITGKMPDTNVPANIPVIERSSISDVISNTARSVGPTLITLAANECLNLASDAICNYANNYNSNLEAGYGIPESAEAAVSDTVQHYADTISEIVPIQKKKMINAIYFVDDDGNIIDG